MTHIATALHEGDPRAGAKPARAGVKAPQSMMSRRIVAGSIRQLEINSRYAAPGSSNPTARVVSVTCDRRSPGNF
jgi:hypothetical protein